VTPDRQGGTTAELGTAESATIFRTPPGHSAVPAFADGWQLDGSSSFPFLSYAEADPSVNWSDELEQLHEESSRTHFLDRWTRDAILAGVGPLPATATIADVGCSTGFLLEDVRAAYPSATLLGVDLIGAGLEKAHRLVPSAQLVRADTCDLPIADARLDAVVSANLLEHVPDDRGALREFHRVLSPGGRAVIVVPAGPSTYDYYDRFLGHERRYGRRELASKCADAGFEIVDDAYIGALLYPPFWLVKQRNRRIHGSLRGDALERQVAGDIARTHDSRIGDLAWRIERRLAAAGVKLPFGIRSLVTARRPD
jgi:SAM-dependent methyltransferase